MSKLGREFEKLVFEIEQALDKTGAIIKSPGYLIDKETDGKREVDVVIRINTGSTNLAIAIECRDRKAANDVRWIEELISKRNSINVDRMIAVSSSDWTSGAKKRLKPITLK